jgi:precorrin-3B methylase
MQNPAVNPSEALAALGALNEPISSETLAKAIEVLKILQTLGSPDPFVFPTDIGGIQFEWHGEWRELDIEVIPGSAKLAYVTFQHGDPVTESDADVSESDLLALLNWIS